MISKVKFISNKLFHWFRHSHLKANPGRCHLFLSSKTWTDVSLGDVLLTTSTKKPYLESWWTQNSVLTKMFLPFVLKLARNYILEDALLVLCLEKRRTLMKGFIGSQFNYCLVIWMSHSRTMNKQSQKALQKPLFSFFSFSIL